MKVIYALLFSFVMLSASVTSARQIPQGKTNSEPGALKELIKEALAREDAGDLAGAIEVNKKILEIAPKNVAAMNTIAGLYGKLEKFQEEIIWARQAITVNPEFLLAYINYGNASAALGHLTEAAKAYEKAQQLDPKSPLPVYSLGVLAEQQNKFEVALRYYQQSVELDAKFEDGYLNMAAMYANLKRFDEAIAALKKTLELNPKAGDAKAMLRDLENRKKS